MDWHTGPLAALDLEATGVDPGTARVIEVGLIRSEADGSSTPLVSTLVDPGVAVPPKVIELTGISEMELAAMGGDPRDVLAETRAAIEELVDERVPIVIYNAKYDWPLLAAELDRHGLDPLPNVPPAILIDPLVLDRHVDRYRKGKRTLGTVAAHYGVRLEEAHRAVGDAAATVAVARAIGVKYEAIRVDGPDLVALQIEAHSTWRDSFNEYLARRGKPDRITEEWPTG